MSASERKESPLFVKRCANCDRNNPSNANANHGFRVVMGEVR